MTDLETFALAVILLGLLVGWVWIHVGMRRQGDTDD